MAGEQNIFSLYITHDGQYFLLRTVRPYFNNASRHEEDKSWECESEQRDKLIEHVGNIYGKKGLTLVGELHGYPIGDVFYSDYGTPQVPVYYMQTEFGKPWIIFGTADSEEEFLTELMDDDELQALKPIGKPIKINVCFMSENNVNFN